MSPKKQDFRQSFTQQLPSMKQRVDASNKGFTLRQSKLALLMLTYLQEREKTLGRDLTICQNSLESEQEYLQQIIAEYNQIKYFLAELFSLKVYSDSMAMEGEKRIALWSVEYPGGKLTGYRSIPEAFKAGIEASLAQKKEVQ